MERRTFAVYAVLVGLLVGLLGNIMFYQKAIGLSFPLFMLIVVGVILVSSRPAGQKLRPRNLWPFIPLLFFALMVVVRADSQITVLNFVAVMALGGLTLFNLPLERNIDELPFVEHILSTLEAWTNLLPVPRAEIVDAVDWFREKYLQDKSQLVAVGRGLLLTLPVLVVFALLLASADEVFDEYLGQLLSMFSAAHFGDTLGRTFVTLALGWMAIGVITYGLARRPRAGKQIYTTSDDNKTVDDAAVDGTDIPWLSQTTEQGDGETDEEAVNETSPPKRYGRPPFTLGMIESGIILGSVDMLFGVFVLIQLAYFFGGQANIHYEGLTYAEYARRGFFELVAVSVLTLGLALVLDWVTIRDGKEQNWLFRGLSIVIVALTAIMLVSASQRMTLYEQAYGFTHLRLYTHVFMLWLGILFGVFLLALFRVRKYIFSLGMLIVVIGYLVTLNLINIDHYIAEHNIARYHEGYELDVSFFYELSVDAVPPILELYESDSISYLGTQDSVRRWLEHQLWQLDRRGGDEMTVFFFSAHLSRDSNWSSLDAIRGELSGD